MKAQIIQQLTKYSEILESYYQDMVEYEYTIEKNKLYILSACIGRRKTDLANLKIIIRMFCEGVITVDTVFKKLQYRQIINILDDGIIENENELTLLSTGQSVSSGIVSAKYCNSSFFARKFIEQKENFIFYQAEINKHNLDIVKSEYCKGVITVRSSLTSHASIICKSLNKPCICNVQEFEKLLNNNDIITIDGNNGKIYEGFPILKKNKFNYIEIKILSELLYLVIKYNIVTTETAILAWRLWDIIIQNKRYNFCTSKKIIKKEINTKYISFKQPDKREFLLIHSDIKNLKNGNILIEDLIYFLQDELSSQVPIGMHYKYMRPLLDPVGAIEYDDIRNNYTQITGIEFYNINKYIDFLIDIYSIKIYFSLNKQQKHNLNKTKIDCSIINYLDFTNPKGESIIINSYNADKLAVYINDILVPIEQLSIIYHLLRRRKYYWTWYKENKVSKPIIIDYLKTKSYKNKQKTRLYFLCNEMNLIDKEELTITGKILLEEENMEYNECNIDYILEQINQRGFDTKPNICDDYSKLLVNRKDFKDLIALELYESYFFSERHEFDLQLLKEIVEQIAIYFCNPNTLQQIESGLLQTIPSAIIISMLQKIWSKLKNISAIKNNCQKEDSSWQQLKNNMKKIDKEFKNHDYIKEEDIETIFGVNRKQILPLLKLCGCVHYENKKRSIWIKPGLKELQTMEILKNNNIKYKH